jgi:hypothetical protein
VAAESAGAPPRKLKAYPDNPRFKVRGQHLERLGAQRISYKLLDGVLGEM